ncbi:MAG: class I SAM-dependent methyltransferase [Caulobacterales bacterium]
MDYFEQLEALAARQGGYFYPWRSQLGAGDGEAAYTTLVEAHLRPDAVVLEAGCGHGNDLLAFAPKVARFIGYDAVEPFIATARERAADAGLTNVELIVHNSSARFNGGAARMPAEPGSVDLIVSRRGPGNWIDDARRVCRPGARLIQLNPLPSPTPAWNEDLPPGLRMVENPANPGHPDLPNEIQEQLRRGGLMPHSAWTFDVPEVFTEPDELYRCLTFMRFEPGVLSLEEARPHLERLLATEGRVDVRQRRYLWMASVD